MKTNNLLSHLTNLEGQLNHFSFEELTSEEASLLKKSFMTFKYRLEEKVLGPKSKISNSNTKNKDFDLTIGNKQRLNTLQNKTSQVEGRLLAKVGDEIRTPINGIIESVDLLKDGNLSSEQISHLNSISTSSNNLLEIINELLEYTKLTSGKERFESIDFNFYSIIRDTMYLCNTLITNKDVTLEVDLDTEIPEILLGDPSKLSQILLTLIGNSIKLIDEGNILLQIKLRKQNSNYYELDFEIRDLPSGTLKNTLRPNTVLTEDMETDIGGSGIGFAMVKGIIQILNGSLTTMATLGDGCAYKFTLPYKKGKQIKTSGLQSDSNNTDTTDKNIEGLHLLVFEDNILIQKIIEQRLKIWGCKVFVTDNALAGMDYMQNHRVDLVLMDLGMPVMNGYQITQIIRDSSNNHIKNIPIIALTGNFTISDKNKCKALGINDYILKPYSPDDLMTTLFKYKKDKESKSLIEPSTGLAHFSLKKEAWEVSLTDLLEECMGEIDLLEELIGLFKQNMLDFIGRANIYIPEGNFNRLGFAAHKVKTGLSMMRADHLYSLVDNITVCCKNNKDLQEIGRLYDQLILAYPMVEKAIDRELMLIKTRGNKH
ncbi:sensor histidine kinase [Arenibacter sp. F20364]|uniref:response regulator n=1 Tax=Arenibacter sp. F20364 TaxID=2926415 RepID=UPI001FF25237|nr:sensor histidine kinase [Arenibacter sp. F20364]MCK0191110.1 response regulator [Arenibacter sp. F20364]